MLPPLSWATWLDYGIHLSPTLTHHLGTEAGLLVPVELCFLGGGGQGWSPSLTLILQHLGGSLQVSGAAPFKSKQIQSIFEFFLEQGSPNPAQGHMERMAGLYVAH